MANGLALVVGDRQAEFSHARSVTAALSRAMSVQAEGGSGLG